MCYMHTMFRMVVFVFVCFYSFVLFILFFFCSKTIHIEKAMKQNIHNKHTLFYVWVMLYLHKTFLLDNNLKKTLSMLSCQLPNVIAIPSIIIVCPCDILSCRLSSFSCVCSKRNLCAPRLRGQWDELQVLCHLGIGISLLR